MQQYIPLSTLAGVVSLLVVKQITDKKDLGSKAVNAHQMFAKILEKELKGYGYEDGVLYFDFKFGSQVNPRILSLVVKEINAITEQFHQAFSRVKNIRQRAWDMVIPDPNVMYEDIDPQEQEAIYYTSEELLNGVLKSIDIRLPKAYEKSTSSGDANPDEWPTALFQAHLINGNLVRMKVSTDWVVSELVSGKKPFPQIFKNEAELLVCIGFYLATGKRLTRYDYVPLEIPFPVGYRLKPFRTRDNPKNSVRRF